MISVLVIEDEASIRANVRRLLTLEGFEVIEAANGKLGLEQAFASLPDIILCDVHMPELDGFAVLHALREHPATEHIPFVFLSSSAEEADLKNGLTLGACRYVTKPFDNQSLLRLIRELSSV